MYEFPGINEFREHEEIPCQQARFNGAAMMSEMVDPVVFTGLSVGRCLAGGRMPRESVLTPAELFTCNLMLSYSLRDYDINM
jgi:hypothetical protein